MKCEACGATVKRRGILFHLRQSQNPACRALLRDELLSFEPSISPIPDDTENEDIPNISTLPQFSSIPRQDDYLQIDAMDTTFDKFSGPGLLGDEGHGIGNQSAAPVTDNGDSYSEKGGEGYSDTEGSDDGDEDLVDDLDGIEESDGEDGLEDVDLDAVMMEPPRRKPNYIQEAMEQDDEEHVPCHDLHAAFERTLRPQPYITKYKGRAGEVLGDGGQLHDEEYAGQMGAMMSQNPYAPFSSRLEWQIAEWAKLGSLSSSMFNDLMKLEGIVEQLGLSFKTMNDLNKIIDMHLPNQPRFMRYEVMVGNEVCDVYFRDIVDCVRALLRDPNLTPYMIFHPEKHFVDESRQIRMYHDMHTTKWWWSLQHTIEKEKPGATVVPVIISTDKTQLTVFRNKSAYPVYLTIGNIPKEIRRKPSSHAYVLLGYLPTTRLENVPNKAARRRMLANLYHACMARILEPLEGGGVDGIIMTTADGLQRRMHLVLAAFVGDYPEQVLTTSIYSGDCPTCPTVRGDLGTFNKQDSGSLRDLDMMLEILDSFDAEPDNFLLTCKDARVKPVVNPFWKMLPYVNIFQSITPDILHQLYQGIIKHLVSWTIKAFGPAEIDARCRRLPPNHNIRTFAKGISSLTHITGEEHEQMARILLGLIIDIPLPNGQSPVRLVRAVRAILDLLFLAQFPVHTDETLRHLEDSLQRFHTNKTIFVDLGIRENFNLPKLHFAVHYAWKIKCLGTTDNFNTAYTERLHIDFAKDAYTATNHKNEFAQMTLWLERREKVQRHAQHIKWKLSMRDRISEKRWYPPGLQLMNRIPHLAKRPSARKISVDDLINKYGAKYFREALARFLVALNNPQITARQLERAIWGIDMPRRNFWVWHRLKFVQQDLFTAKLSTVDSIHAQPSSRNRRRQLVPGRFDTALIKLDDHDDHSTAGAANASGYQVGRIRAIFTIPRRQRQFMINAGLQKLIPKHLAYVEWFSKLENVDPNHLMYKIKAQIDPEGGRICSIIPVSKIFRSVHLFPKFGSYAQSEWTSDNVLDTCNTFYVNPFTDHHLYRVLA